MKKTLITTLIISLSFADCIDKLKGKYSEESYTPQESKVNIQGALEYILKQEGLKVKFPQYTTWYQNSFELEKNQNLYDTFNDIMKKHNLVHKCIENNTTVDIKEKKEIRNKQTIINLDYDLNQSDFNYLMTELNLKEKFNISEDKNIKFNDNLNFIFVDMDANKINSFKDIIKSYMIAKKKSDKKSPKALINENGEEMNVTIIPLKYIHATGLDNEEKNSKLDILEETLKHLMGTNFIKSDSNTTLFDESLSYIKVDKRTNSIIAKDTTYKIKELIKIVKKIDKPVKLIDIEVLILSANKNFRDGFGVKLGGGNRYNIDYTDTLKDKDGNAIYNNLGKYGFTTSSSIADSINQASQIPTQETTLYQKYTPESSSKSSNNNVIVTNSPDTVTYESTTTTSPLDSSNAVIEKANSINLLNPLSSLGLSTSLFFIADKKSFQVQIDAYEDSGDVKVLSNPHIVTLDHKQGKILSGKSVTLPLITEDKMTREEVEGGVSIEATPHIIKKSDDDNFTNAEIMLEINVEKSSLGAVSTQNIEKTQDSITTTVIIKNNQTLVLGGLYDYTESKSNGGIPLLRKIPILGKFFSTSSESQDKNELLFFITPRVVEQEDLNKTRSRNYLNIKKERYRFYSKKLDEIADIFEDFNVTEKNSTKKEVESNDNVNTNYSDSVKEILWMNGDE